VTALALQVPRFRKPKLPKRPPWLSIRMHNVFAIGLALAIGETVGLGPAAQIVGTIWMTMVSFGVNWIVWKLGLWDDDGPDEEGG
jgi:hypothetical protein